MNLQPTFEVFANYTLLEQIACGGMASIYLARPSHAHANGRLLVIKRILPHVATDPEFVKMFRDEIQVCMGFNHPNIVHIFDFGQNQGQPYIAMEYIEGKSIRQITAQFANGNQLVPIPVAVSIVSQVAAGLHYAHTFKNPVTGEELNTIHRDVSPQNIIVTYDGNVKLIDFGIAKADNRNADATRTGTIKGKISYLSPEQIGHKALDGRSDIFSLGVVLWEMLAGRRLFSLEERDELQLLLAIQKCDQSITPPSKFNPQVPAELDAIVMKTLRQKADDRYENAAELQKALREFLINSFSGFGYADVANAMKAVFQDEITKEQFRIRQINAEAQNVLTQQEPTSHTGSLQGYIPKFISAKKPEQNGSLEAFGASSMPVAAENLTRATGEMSARLRAPGLHFPAITRTHLLMALLTVCLLWLAETDREYMLFARLFMPTDAVREASTPEVSPIRIRKLANLSQETSVDGVTDVAATQKLREVMLRVDVFPEDKSNTTVIKVNGKALKPKSSMVRVPMDKPLIVHVQRKSFATYKGELILSSNDANPKTKVYRLPIRLQRTKH
jgi:serine/threonine protein kinase